jgi:ABC-type phosphate transport system substrate-binding protein/serine/threonine protein kinase
VRLIELFYIVSGKFREAENLIRHPKEIFMQKGQRVAEEQLTAIEVPIGTRSPKPDVKPNTELPYFQPPQTAQHLTSDHGTTRQLLVSQTASSSQDIILQGRKGKYQRTARLSSTAKFNLYQGNQISSHKRVLIKEYFLPEREFNQSEVQACKDQFINATNLNFKTNGGQDFRLVLPWDSIASSKSAERSCYLITEPIPNSICLRDYINQRGAVPAAQVREILKQVLQTLWFLHNQRVRLGSGAIQRELSHSNLNLDSLLVVSSHSLPGLKEPQLQVYVTDLGIWEKPFISPHLNVQKLSSSPDLTDLGKVAVSLLTGMTLIEPVIGRSINPEINSQWITIQDQPLKRFVRQLLGLERAPFFSAFTAREALLTLPEPYVLSSVSQPIDNESDGSIPLPRWILVAAVLGMLGILFAIALWGMRSLRSQQSSPLISSAKTCSSAPASAAEGELPPCRLSQVVLPSRFTYAVETGGSWEYALQKTGLVGENVALIDALRTRHRVLGQSPKPAFISSERAIAQVKSGQTNFALISQLNQQPLELGNDLIAVPVAYDGLGVFVAFSDATEQSGIPSQLKGKVSLSQLRQLYTGRVNGWTRPAALDNWAVKLYVSDDLKLVSLFEQQVLHDQEAIAAFRNLKSQGSTLGIDLSQQNAYRMFGAILQDFENDAPQLGIGFGLLSQAFGQCSVYPLAVSVRDVDAAVQPLVQNNGQPVDPTTDLCNDKGGYALDVNAFSSDHYPLTIVLEVIYPKEGDRAQAGQQFAAMLQTEEGQQLLRETGLVPIRKLP